MSHEGEHKCVAIWEYDKRPANGAQFVYYGMRLYQSDGGAREDALVRYVFSVLDALFVRHGPSHAEVMWLAGEQAPCLVEVGCRPHGGEGTFHDLVETPIGYSKLSVMLDAIEKPYRFHRLPARPERFSAGAMEVRARDGRTARARARPRGDAKKGEGNTLPGRPRRPLSLCARLPDGRVRPPRVALAVCSRSCSSRTRRASSSRTRACRSSRRCRRSTRSR